MTTDPSAGPAPLDPRLNAFRPDLADIRLKGRVDAAAFVEGQPAETRAPVAPLRGAPERERGVTATLLMGEPVEVFERTAHWVWLRSRLDGYVGYAAADAVGPVGPEPTHRVVAPRTHVYPAPELKRPPLDWAPMGARLALDPRAEPVARFVRLAPAPDQPERWIYAAHLAPLSASPAADWVTFAESLLGTPYLWGGDSAEGIDCSGLIQTALDCVGIACPRDSDMQEADLGAPISLDGPFKRGDLIFWRGHVGVMRCSERLLHANAWAMAVASEPLAEARARIARMDGGPATAARRLSVAERPG